MTYRFAGVTYVDSAKAAQEYYGSRAHNDRLQTIAVTGARIITTIANQMKRPDIRHELVSSCVTSAIAEPMLLERA